MDRDATIRLVDLSCERMANPLGVDDPHPRLSWRLKTDRTGARQVAYRVRVGHEIGGDDLWDSGRVDGDATLVRYAGLPVAAKSRANWTVTAWDEQGEEIEAQAFWETGPGAWSGAWVQSSLVGGPRTGAPSPYLRRAFTLAQRPTRARLYVTALGVYEARINGERVGDDELAPGWTDFRKRVRYQAHNVTDLLREGENRFDAILGDGWYAGHLETRDREFYGDRPRLLAQLHVWDEDGVETVVATDGDWTFGVGAILEADLMMGEAHDLRKEPTDWKPVAIADVTANVVAQSSPPIRVVETIRPVSIDSRAPDRAVFDLGQNMVGRVRLRVRGAAGATVTLRYAERLLPDGEIYTENYRGAKSIDTVVLTGGEDVFEPKFTFHGFQYVEVSGLPETPSLDDLTGVVLGSDWRPTGVFECGDPLIQKLAENVRWGWKGNSVDVPTDCPQRDERLGWTGDAQVFVRTACFLGDVETFFEKYQQDLEDAQGPNGSIPPVAPHTGIVSDDGGPAWSDAVVICPWTVYRHYGDPTILERHFDSMRRWVDSLEGVSRDGIRSYEGMPGFSGFGDWLSTNAVTPNDLIGTAFYAHCAGLLARIAETIGRDGTAYRTLSENVKGAFRREFVAADGTVASGTQTANVLALHFDLLEEAHREKALDAIVRDVESRGDKLSTGFVGTPYLLHVLTQGGRLDVAYRLLRQKGWPSWLYPVTQGATTIWERWDGWTEENGFQDVGMNSFNHYAYGAVEDWLVATVAGIDLVPDVPGFKRSLLAPRPGGGLPSAGASLLTRHGPLESRWTREGDRFDWSVTVPPNTVARAVLPPEAQADWTERELEPGRYRFETGWTDASA